MLTNVIPRATQPIRPAQEPDRTMPDLSLESVPATSRPVREVQAVCSKHAVLCGAPDSLARFMQALPVDKHLAMDFWSLVARLADQGHTADAEWLLATIVEGVTSQSVADLRAASPSQRALVRRLEMMLAGHDELTEPAEETDPVELAPTAAPVQTVEPAALRAEPQPELTHRGTVTEAAPARPVGGPRLVLWPEEAAVESSTATVANRNEPEPEPTLPLRKTAPNDDRKITLDEDAPEPQIAVPLASYADEADRTAFTPGRMLAAVVALVLVAGGVWLLRRSSPYDWQRLYDGARSGYASVVSMFHHPAAPSTSSSPADSSATSPTSDPNMNPAVASPAQPVSQPANNAAAANNTASAVPTAAPAVSPATSRPASAKPAPTEAIAAEAARRAAAQGPEPAHVEPQMEVPASTMRQYLVSSRIPIYPDGAHGTVVIQAIITSRGTVEPLHVISGSPELRQAALEAVSTWHYRPYLVNGVPADVATTISVNDTGND